MKLLVTAFAPFGGATSNSSLIVLNRLREMDWRGEVEFYFPVPVEFATAWSHVRQVLNRTPDIGGVLALGQAESRARISLEKVALNWIDARIPDNSGFVPPRAKIGDGPDMRWCNIPWDEFTLSPLSERSYSAGTYVCNSLFYQAAGWAETAGKKAGFVHIPVLRSQQESDFDKFPKLDDAAAIQEVARILDFALKFTVGTAAGA